MGGEVIKTEQLIRIGNKMKSEEKISQKTR